MNPEDQNNTNDHETLVAYLDGELDHAATVEVENRLAVDPDYRHHLQRLEKTWDMLDELPAVEPTDSFTRSTLELVVNDAKAAIRKQRFNLGAVLLRGVILIAIPCICYFVTSGILQWKQNAPINKLVQDVPFLQKYELYEAIGNIEFAELLDKQKLLNDIDAYDSNSGEEKFTWEPSHEALDNLTDDERIDLRRAKTRYETILTDVEREALQTFHQEVASRPDRDQLLSAMQRFHIWSTETTFLSPKNREIINSLGDMEPVEAIDKIKELLREERQSMVSSTIPKDDKDIVFQWFDGLLLENETKIRDRITVLKGRKRYADYLSRIDANQPPDVLAWILVSINPEFVMDLISDEKLEELKSSLSNLSQRVINGKANETEQRRFIVMMNTRIYVSKEKLREFYDTQMTDEERKELEGVTGSELRERVRKKYIMHRIRNGQRGDDD